MSYMDDFEYLKISLKCIQVATNNFGDKPIGSGGFGDVYKGELVLTKGARMVAFKRLHSKVGQGDVEFWKEIIHLSGLKHKNLATLLHFCNEDKERILVYKYASRGSLDKYLGDANLTWTQRLYICLGAARGIAYLHDPKKTQQRILHRDIKSSNILLDDKWTAKVSDFGLSKMGPANQARSYVVSNICGTPGYCDPMYFETGILSKECDVYSFGVVLFEVMCGRLCCMYDKDKFIGILVQNWRNCYTENRLYDIIFPDLKKQINQESLLTFAAIANQCLNRDHKKRPHMVEIIKELEAAIHQQNSSQHIPYVSNAMPVSYNPIDKFHHLKIHLEYVKSATNNFDDRLAIGIGGFSKEVVKKNSNNNLLSKIATNNGHGENSPYFDGWKVYDADPFNHQHNPNGVIQMGLAENQLCFDLIQKWVEENPNASICTPQGSSDFEEIAIFQDYHGLPEFRAAIANFMSHVRGNRVKFDPARIVMSGGATGAHETVAFCLANPGEAFLVPTPYYPGFDRDLRWRTGVELVPVVCESSNNFKITREALETAYDNAILANIKVKGLLITNPSNPLGTFLDKDTLKDLVSFINEKNIHLVCDEIYAATVTSGDEFVSIAEVINEEPTCNQDLIHIVYSLSKDMGFPGFRVWIVYSYNDIVVNIAHKMSSFGLVSTQTQHMLASMLSDNKFVENFISESRVRLARRHDIFTRGLSQVGIGSLESNAGLFFWMDLRRFLKEPTFESEMMLWRIIVNEVKLNVSPGQSFHCSEPGWFRVCFANMDDKTTEIALTRIEAFVLVKKKLGIKTKRQMWQSNLHLRFLSRRLDDMLTPHLMSPHSPLASPLVRAQT